MSVLTKSAAYAKIATIFLFRMIVPFVFGIILNWIFSIFFLGQWFGDVSWWNTIPTLLLMVLFLAGFPFAYFWLGRGHATKKGIEVLYKGSHPIVSKMVGLVVTKVVKNSSKASESTVFKKKGVKKTGEILKQIDAKVPRFVKWILSFILIQTPIQSFLVEVGKDIELKPENLPIIIPKVQEKVDTFVVEELIGVGLLGFWVLVGINVVVMVLASWWI